MTLCKKVNIHDSVLLIFFTFFGRLYDLESLVSISITNFLYDYLREVMYLCVRGSYVVI
jgi:hypothetical protein